MLSSFDFSRIFTHLSRKSTQQDFKPGEAFEFSRFSRTSFSSALGLRKHLAVRAVWLPQSRSITFNHVKGGSSKSSLGNTSAQSRQTRTRNSWAFKFVRQAISFGVGLANKLKPRSCSNFFVRSATTISSIRERLHMSCLFSSVIALVGPSGTRLLLRSNRSLISAFVLSLMLTGCQLQQSSEKSQTSIATDNSDTPIQNLSPSANFGMFTVKANLLQPRQRHRCLLLENGKVLIWNDLAVLDADSLKDHPPSIPSDQFELFDPALNKSQSLGRTIKIQADATKSVRINGIPVLQTAANKEQLPYLFLRGVRPTWGQFGYTAVLLPTGKILLMGGSVNLKSNWAPMKDKRFKYKPSGNYVVGTYNCELYDPIRKTFEPAPSMNVPRSGFSASVLTTGKVLICGGVKMLSKQFECIPESELYNPADNTFRIGPRMHIGRADHIATTLLDGRILITGGDSGTLLNTPVEKLKFNSDQWRADYVVQGEVYDPANNQFLLTGPLVVKRIDHNATLLENGRVLITGGMNMKHKESPGTSMSDAEVFDPTSKQFIPIAKMREPRRWHCSILLPNGKVFITGGEFHQEYEGDWQIPRGTTELYSPANTKSHMR